VEVKDHAGIGGFYELNERIGFGRFGKDDGMNDEMDIGVLEWMTA